jgi:hypothetical protein
MNTIIKSDRLSFKIGSFEWLNFFGLPAFFIFISFIFLYSFIKDSSNKDSQMFLVSFVLTVFIGVVSYIIQFKRLKFKTLKITKEIEILKVEIRELLTDNKWEIDYDNRKFLQATYRGSIFGLDMLTLRYGKSEIKWNVIYHPQSNNSLAALFSLNRQGRKIVEKIKACA